MSSVFPVTHSLLRAQSIVTDVLPLYSIAQPTSCTFLNFGLNDTYVVASPTDRYILRVYHAGWRAEEDILHELDVLAFLNDQGVPVSAPIPRTDGSFTHTVSAPEGPRTMALFSYAPGRFPLIPHEEQTDSYHFGQALARIHAATDTFQSPHRRFALDLDHLMEQPLAAIEPFLQHRSDDWNYLRGLANRLRERIERVPGGMLDQGFCHGDVHSGNARIGEDGTVTFFDFDCCGKGWRAYDLAVFRWHARLYGNEQEQWPHFLWGYQEARHIGDEDIALTAIFVAVRLIWITGLHTSNGHIWGIDYIHDYYFDQAFTFLREWEAEHFAS